MSAPPTSSAFLYAFAGLIVPGLELPLKAGVCMPVLLAYGDKIPELVLMLRESELFFENV